MRYAISTEGECVSAHFGRCPMFTLVDIENGAVTKTETAANPGHEPGAIPQFLHGHGASVIIAGGMGHRAQGFFDQLGIRAIVGVSGTISDTIEKLCDGTLTGGSSMCSPGAGRGYGIPKNECDHGESEHE